jgi:hypothetical protein
MDAKPENIQASGRQNLAIICSNKDVKCDKQLFNNRGLLGKGLLFFLYSKMKGSFAND